MRKKEALGEEAAGRIRESAAQAIVDAIREVGGREVFFAGSLDGEGLVAKVRVWARGTEGAVPAVHHGLKKGEVVIHNHPSGNVAPSDADVQLASIFGFNGHGVYIVDNSVTRVFVVVEPLRSEAKFRLNPAELAELFSPASALARTLPHFEVRPQQIRMMEHVAAAFNDEGIAVVEAPTGVGKTMAYLAPAVLWALRNKERVVISTRTINLQEQIVHKDIPALQKALGLPFNAVLVKGRSNYLCIRKLRRALSEATLLKDEKEEEILKAVAEWAEHTKDGSLADLPFVPPRDLWAGICSESDTCRLSACPDPKRCFVGRARRDMAKADILVANHHMTFSDLAVKRETGSFTSAGVLPAYRRIIFDEAHNIEDSATDYFGVEATRLGALAAIGRFVRSETGVERGLIPYLKLKLMRDVNGPSVEEYVSILDLIDNKLLPALAATRHALTAAFDAIRQFTSASCGQIGREIKWRLTEEVLAMPELRRIHGELVLPSVEETNTCAKLVTLLLTKIRDIPAPADGSDSPFMTECFQLEAYGDRLRRLASALAEGTDAVLAPNTVRWIEIDSQNKAIVRIIRCPLEVGKPMAEWVFPSLTAVVMTSATLSVGHTFEFLKSRIGLDRVDDREVETLALDSPFDFQKQAILAIPTDLPNPDAKEFLDASVESVRNIVRITNGHAFVLFTSFYALDYTYKHLELELKDAGITPLKQGAIARTRLLDRFRKEHSSVLFGTDSFWEGVDVAGSALQCVILTKLPFRVPTEPVLQARAEAIDGAGGNSFMEYTVPQAVVKFRQGFGRLIRRKTDRGAIVVLDRRIMTKHYGRVFLQSLPEMNRIAGPSTEIYEALQGFFLQQPETDR
ncbi:MAG: DEAD/DEAH box helicase [Candidatus Hydrogenedentes bacterium]|nr:DEAD/DEAH box helicase [Candidatus Hydrogenedentota bacterium]